MGAVLSISIDAGGPTASSRVGLERNGDEIEVFARSQDGGVAQAIATDSVNLTPGVWHHVTAVVDYAADSILVYVDGVLESTTGSIDFLNNAAPNTPSSSAALGAEGYVQLPGTVDVVPANATAAASHIANSQVIFNMFVPPLEVSSRS